MLQRSISAKGILQKIPCEFSGFPVVQKVFGLQSVLSEAANGAAFTALDRLETKEVRQNQVAFGHGTIPAEASYTTMNSLSLNPKWSVLKKRLRERYQHLTEADLAEIESGGDEWLLRIQQRIGGSSFEIAQLVEEITETPPVGLHMMAFGERERICA
jgi:hypothetical protein